MSANNCRAITVNTLVRILLHRWTINCYIYVELLCETGYPPNEQNLYVHHALLISFSDDKNSVQKSPTGARTYTHDLVRTRDCLCRSCVEHPGIMSLSNRSSSWFSTSLCNTCEKIRSLGECQRRRLSYGCLALSQLFVSTRLDQHKFLHRFSA